MSHTSGAENCPIYIFPQLIVVEEILSPTDLFILNESQRSELGKCKPYSFVCVCVCDFLYCCSITVVCIFPLPPPHPRQTHLPQPPYSLIINKKRKLMKIWIDGVVKRREIIWWNNRKNYGTSLASPKTMKTKENYRRQVQVIFNSYT